MAMPGAFRTAYKSNNYNGITQKNIKALDLAISSPEAESAARNMYILQLKSKVAKGEINEVEQLNSLNEYDKSVALYKKVPADISPAKKRQALGLLLEKSKINEAKEGKDDAMVVRMNERLKQIDARDFTYQNLVS